MLLRLLGKSVQLLMVLLPVLVMLFLKLSLNGMVLYVILGSLLLISWNRGPEPTQWRICEPPLPVQMSQA